VEKSRYKISKLVFTSNKPATWSKQRDERVKCLGQTRRRDSENWDRSKTKSTCEDRSDGGAAKS